MVILLVFNNNSNYNTIKDQIYNVHDNDDTNIRTVMMMMMMMMMMMILT